MEAPMRVLLSSLNSPTWLAEALAEQPGLDVHCLVAEYVDLGDFGVSAPQPAPGARYALHTLPVVPRHHYPYSLFRGRLAGLLREIQPDVIYHLGEPSELSAWQVVRAARRNAPQSALIAFSFENVLRRWDGFPRLLRGRAQRAVLAQLDWVAACSHSAQTVLKQEGFPPDRIRVVYHAVQAQAFTPQRDPALHDELAGADGFLIGYVGRLVHEKGLDVLLRALALLPREFALALIGDGREQEALTALAAELGVSDRVRWLGRQARPDLPRYMSSLDALVLPSRGIADWQEQFGAVLVEGMLCETPVIGSSSGAIPEIIGPAGLVFPEGDAPALAGALQGLRNDPAQGAELARAGRARALREFSLESYLGRLLPLFEEAVAARCASL
jgi:glycosyltransferase involved in cell wall biosynthesis